MFKGHMMQISNQMSTIPIDIKKYSRENIAKELGFKGELKDVFIKEVNGMSSGDFLRLSDKDRAKLHDRLVYPLTGYTRVEEAKVSIFGKLMGYDPNFSSEEIRDLKDFIDESKSLGIEKIPTMALRDTVFTVDELIQTYASHHLLALVDFKGTKTADLLDSDLSIDEFKTQWAKHTLQERFNVMLSDEDAKNSIEILKKLQSEQDNEPKVKEKEKKFKPMQVVSKMETYKDEATSELRELYEFIKHEFDNGKSIFGILEAVAKSRKDMLV